MDVVTISQNSARFSYALPGVLMNDPGSALVCGLMPAQ
jgi:hypothetical protein